MPEVPKIVHDRLRAGLAGSTVPEASHPDPDLLTAFAEQALSAAEREGVLQHLERCGDCRELVALSIPAMESSSQPATAEESEATVSVASTVRAPAGGQRSWFAWPGLRWAALAAGVVVAGGILLIHPGKPNAVREATQQPTNTAKRPEETIVAKQAVPAGAAVAEENQREKELAKANRAFSRDQGLKLVSPSAIPPENIIVRGQIEPSGASKDVAVGPATGAAINAAPTRPAPAPQVPSASEMVEVTTASGPVTTEEARSDLSLTARQLSDLQVSGRQVSDLTITKAKAAKTELNAPPSLQRSENLDKKQATTDAVAQRQRAAAGMSTVGALHSNPDKADLPQSAEHHAQWAIHGNDLQCLLDSSAGWKTVLHSDRPLLCYAAGGQDIWAGGKNGDLFHSANGGVTWNQVHPSAQQQTLSDDVTHIDIYSPSQIVLFTSTSQSWSTADGGKTWAKK
jgi:hypothetical protein